MEREPNRLLQRLIAEAGFTHKGLARRLNDLGAARGLSGLRYDHSSVLRWLAGQRPRDPVTGLLAEIFALRLGRAVSPEDLGLPAVLTPLDLGQEFNHTWQEGISTVTALWRGDVETKVLTRLHLRDRGRVRRSAALADPSAGGPPRGAGHPARRHGRHRGDPGGHPVLRRAGQQVRRRQGPPAVVKYLDTAVAPLLGDGSYAENTGKALASAAAELTRLAGWMAYDLEQHGLAQRYLIQALRLARGAGDHGLGGEILAGMSHQAIYIGQPAHALDLARAAQLSARRAGVFALLAETHVLEAHAHAALDDRAACASSLHEAELSFDRRRAGHEPDWISYFDEAYLSAKFAHCFRDLGDGPGAVRHARRSLEMDGRYVRGRMFNLSLLSAGLLASGELEEACSVAVEALALARGLESARTRSYVADLRRRLDPHAAERPVVELNERVRELNPA